MALMGTDPMMSQQFPVSGPRDQGDLLPRWWPGRLWSEVSLLLARVRLTVSGRAGFFHPNHRLAAQAFPDRIYTLWVPTDKIQSAPLPSYPATARHATGLPSNVRFKASLVWLYPLGSE